MERGFLKKSKCTEMGIQNTVTGNYSLECITRYCTKYKGGFQFCRGRNEKY